MRELALVNSAFASHDWESILEGSVIACYFATETEPGTQALIEKLIRAGLSVYLPIISNDGSLLWGVATEDMANNAYGIAEPVNSVLPMPQFTSVIVPAIAAGKDGSRLGRGGGYYDRWLETLPSSADGGPLRIVLVFDDEVFQTVPVDAHDQRINVIVTPGEIYHVST